MKRKTSRKLVVFDDDKDILYLCKLIFEELGWQVYTHETCNKIIEKVKLTGPDVILMDDWIPDQGGVNATQTLKKEDTLKNIPVLYFSARNEVATHASEAGADDYLAKPFDISELKAKIEKLVK